MLFDLSRAVQRHFSHPGVAAMYRSVRAYLPRERFREFRRSYVFNNLLRGPRRRRRIERRHGCELPASINVSPTEVCNLRCRGCYAAAYDRGREMEPEQIETIISQARQLGIFFMCFLGGEPLLRKDLLPLLARHKDMAFRISTNGTVVDDEVVAWLKRLGNVVLFFSVEGLAKHTDESRGAGVYDQVAASMRRLARERVLFGFSALLHAGNAATVASPEFLDEMQRLGNRFGLFFPYGPVGREQHFDLVLEERRLERALASLEALQPRYSMLLLHEGRGCHDARGGATWEQGCRAGVTVHITPTGHVEPCNGIQFHTENVLEKGLLETFRSAFYRDVSRCVKQNDGRCIAIFEPEQLLTLVGRHEASPSNPAALPCLVCYTEARRGRLA